MKTRIHTLQDTLAFQLQGLYYAEVKIKEELGNCDAGISSHNLRQEVQKYVTSTDEKLLKFERIFNYLMQEPELRKNTVITRMLDDTREMLTYTDSSHLRDILMVSCLQNLNAYKISSLKIAYMLTLELGLDTAADLLQQVLEWELETAKALSRTALEEFNKTQTANG